VREAIEPPRAVAKSQADSECITDHTQSEGFHDYRSWDTGTYRDVREIWERAEPLAGEDKFKTELIRGLNA
jgi:hypothetical protein